MPAIITTKFRINNAEQFREGFGESASTKVYFGIGRPYPWNNEKTPDLPIDTVADEYSYWEDMLALKRCTASDVTQCVIRRDWKSGQFYDMYRHDYSVNQGNTNGVDIDTGISVGRASLYESSFFVLTDEYNVYKCLYNRNSNNVVVPSTVKPTGKSTDAILTGDGYVWKYMYTIAPADVIKFISTDFMPVKEVTINPGQYDAYIDQWLVREAAADAPGALNIVEVIQGGQNYTTAPTVIILGDGEGALAEAVINPGTGRVVKINITEPGSGYTYATAVIAAGGGTGATAKVIIPPQNGHGYNPVEELGGYYVMMNVRLEYDDGTGDFPVDNDYRRIMVIRDPFNYNTEIISTAITLKATKEIVITSVEDYIEDELITGGDSSAVGRVINVVKDNVAGTTTVRYILLRSENLNGQDFEVGEDVTGSESLAIGVVGSLINPEVQPHSGDVMYVENRRLINRAPDQIEDIKIVVEM
jgi:hypothetical protein